MEQINHKIFTLLALREGAKGARTLELERAYQDAFDKRLSIIGGIISGEPRPKGMFLRLGELAAVGLTVDDARAAFDLDRVPVRPPSRQYVLKGEWGPA